MNLLENMLLFTEIRAFSFARNVKERLKGRCKIQQKVFTGNRDQ